MRTYRREDRFDAPVHRVEACILDERLFPLVVKRASMVGDAHVVERRRDDGKAIRVARFRAAKTPRGAAYVLKDGELTWTERVEWDLAANRGRFWIEPDLLPSRRGFMDCQGTYVLEAEGEATVREVVVKIEIGVPMVGGLIEGAVLRRVKPQLDAEADALRELLAATGA